MVAPRMRGTVERGKVAVPGEPRADLDEELRGRVSSAPMSTFDLAEAVVVLERTPLLLDAWLRDLPEAWLTVDEGEGTFSPREVVGHLIHGERTDWIPRSRIVLEHGETRPFDPYDRFAQRREMAGKTTRQLLDEFAGLRRDNLATLRGWRLGPAELDRRGRHPELGVVTLRELVATWAVHDLNHVAQIARVMGKRYRDTVGPWRAYLPMLDR